MKTIVDLNANEVRAAIIDWLHKNQRPIVDGKKLEVSFGGTSNELEARVVITDTGRTPDPLD